MDDFLAFLKSSATALKNRPVKSEKIHLTLGNESCDLDSSVASLVLAYFLSKQHPEKLVIPVLNVSRDNFLLRTENCFVLNQANVCLNDLVFRNEIEFEDIISKYTVTVSLVDHHVLSKKDEVLASHVTEIWDHRPVDPSSSWDPKKVQIRIEQVGSCCTLIADEILKVDSTVLSSPVAYLLYQTIIYDTIALKPENHKATALDIKLGSELEKKYNFTEDRQVLFDKLWKAHNDISHLTPRQLLNKDLKLVEGVCIPGLPVLVEQYFNLEGSMEATAGFAEEYKVTCLLLVGLNASGGTVQRDLAIYATNVEDKLRKALLETLLSNTEHDFMFEHRKTKFDDKIHLLHVHNIKLSRKQLVPLVKIAWKKYICQRKKIHQKAPYRNPLLGIRQDC